MSASQIFPSVTALLTGEGKHSTPDYREEDDLPDNQKNSSAAQGTQGKDQSGSTSESGASSGSNQQGGAAGESKLEQQSVSAAENFAK